MLEINPVLAGKFDNLPYRNAATASVTGTTTATNLQTADIGATASTVGQTSTSPSIDARRYTQWDRTATEVHTDANMSFGDVLDMLNPLQHIPVASSVYRAITGDTINPVSRIAGDILYGGAFGVASAIMGGVGAISNSVMEASSGQDSTSYVLASLFGDDKAKTDAPASATTMVADAGSTTNSNPTSGFATPAPALAAAAPATVVAANNATAPALNSLTAANAGKMLPLNRGKQPYGGAMAPVGATPAMGGMPMVTPGNVDMATATMALNQAAHGVRIGNTIYTNSFNRTPGASSIASATASDPTLSSATPSTPANTTANTAGGSSPDLKNPLPQSLMDDLAMLKSLNQYNTTASNRNLGSTVNLAN